MISNYSCNVSIGKNVYIHPSTVLWGIVRIGNNVSIGPNCTIGYDGFQFPRDKDGVPYFDEHYGGVIIEDNVVIQSNCAVSRARIKNDNTIIGKNTKLDNLIHIAHNCKIGESNIFAAGVVLSGGVHIGEKNFFGIRCGIINDCHIGSYNMIGMSCNIIRDIDDNGVWVGNPAKKIRDNNFFNKEK